MARQCLFCRNSVDSKEHIFPNWIIKGLKHAEPITATIGKKPSFHLAKPEIRVGFVCKSCNNVWMSNLEADNKPAIQAMMNNDPCPLTTKTQTALSRWAVMKAMVIDAINSQRPFFYGSSERDNFIRHLRFRLAHLFGLVGFPRKRFISEGRTSGER